MPNASARGVKSAIWLPMWQARPTGFSAGSATAAAQPADEIVARMVLDAAAGAGRP